MVTVVEEVGSVVAENVGEILETAQGVPAAPHAEIWHALVEGGWGAVTADPDNGVEPREILEIARVTGRFPYSTPLVSTLLAARWGDRHEQDLAAGVVIALERGDQVVAPYYSPGARVVTSDGDVSLVEPLTVGTFSLVAPVAILPASTHAVPGVQAKEARAAYAAVGVGCADAVLSRAIDWVQTREQFGRPLKDFQAVRHHLADAHIAREQAWTAAIAAVHEPEAAARWARQSFALARTVIEIGIQVHGGVGFTWEVGLHHFLDQVVELDSILGAAR